MSTETKTEAVAGDDPRLTAYALGELSGDERSAFEAEIEGDEGAKRELAEITGAADVLRAELRRAPQALGDAQRDAIAAALARRAAKPAVGSGPSEHRAEVVPIARAADKRASRFRAMWIAVPAVAAAAALFVGTTTHRAGAPAERNVEVMASAAGAPQATAAPGDMPAPAPMSPRASEVQAQSRGEAKQKLKQADGRERVRGLDSDDPMPQRPGAPVVGEPSPTIVENPFIDAAKDAKSTFSVDVDTASYAIIRSTIDGGALPNPDVVRVEEMVNYFPYADPPPEDEPFGVTTAVAAAPWAKDHRLLRIGLKGRNVPMSSRPPTNLVFLLDVSGSMTGPDRLGLVKDGLKLLVRQLDARDHVAIVVYAGAAGLVLPSTPGSDRRTILDALDRLEAGGSTNGGAGIELAYAQAAASFVQGGSNRVLLATDGDFNVGVSGKEGLIRLAQEKAKTGVFLTVLGFGQGNLRDSTLEQVADKGNGSYAYIDSLAEAKKVLVDQAAGTLMTIAKDVKIQMAFDPAAVSSFRLIGYENRVMAHQDFTDDKKDAGEIGAGHTVTALYEIVPRTPKPASGQKLGSLALRFKQPDGVTSKQIDFPVIDGGGSFESAPTDLRFGAAVAGFGMKLRGSKYLGDFGFADAAHIAEGALGEDLGGHRRGFVTLVQKAAALAR